MLPRHHTLSSHHLHPFLLTTTTMMGKLWQHQPRRRKPPLLRIYKSIIPRKAKLKQTTPTTSYPRGWTRIHFLDLDFFRGAGGIIDLFFADGKDFCVCVGGGYNSLTFTDSMYLYILYMYIHTFPPLFFFFFFQGAGREGGRVESPDLDEERRRQGRKGRKKNLSLHSQFTTKIWGCFAVKARGRGRGVFFLEEGG